MDGPADAQGEDGAEARGGFPRLLELVHTEDPESVAAMGSRLFPEAGGVAAVPGSEQEKGVRGRKRVSGRRGQEGRV